MESDVSEGASLSAHAPEDRSLLDAVPDAIIGVDGSGLIRFANRQTEELFGYRPEELLGQSVETLVPQRLREDHAADRAHYALQPITRPMGTGRALFARRKDGTEFPVDISLSSHDTDAGRLVLAAVRDITERRAVEEALQEVTERFGAAFEDAPIGMALIELDGRPVLVNDALCRLLGEPKQKILAGSSSFLEEHGITIGSSVRTRLLTGPERIVRDERRHVRPDGQGGWDLVGVSLLSGAGGRPAHFLVQVEDISATREAEERLAYQALHDPLTGLANRTLVLDRLEQALARSRRSGGLIGLLFLDLDHFKVVNDSIGHDAGDRLLASVGVHLRALLREGDTAGRLGGDEFVLVFENLGDEQEARVIAGRVAAALEAPFIVDGHDLTVGASIGIVLARGGASTPQEMLRDADAAMYRAKEGGRGRYEMFDDAMRLRAMERLKIEAESALG